MASALEVFLMAGIVVAVAKWPIGQPAKKPKETNIGFFIHDILSGDHQTGVVVAGVNESKSNALKFGTVLAVDNPVTEGFERSSKEIGRAQGVYANSGHDGQSFYVGLSIVFTNQKYNGSTLQIQGTDLFALKLRELSIVFSNMQKVMQPWKCPSLILQICLRSPNSISPFAIINDDLWFDFMMWAFICVFGFVIPLLLDTHWDGKGHWN